MHVLPTIKTSNLAPIAQYGIRNTNAPRSTLPTTKVTTNLLTRRRLPPFSRRPTVAVAATQTAPVANSDAVTTTKEDLPNNRVRLTVTVPSTYIKRYYKKTLEKYRLSTNVDGYRKGKAPDAVLIEALGGQQRFNNTVLGELLEPTLESALSPYADIAIDESEAIEENAQQLEEAFNPATGFMYHVVFDTLPEVKWKTPYKTLTVTVEEAGNATTDAEIVEQRILAIQKERSKLKIVADRGARRGDVVIIDFAASLAETKTPILGTQRKGMQLDTETADTSFMPGVVDLLEGMKSGESKTEAPLTFPSDEAFQPAEMRGVKSLIDVTLKEVFEYELIEMTDAWAEEVAPGAGGMSGLRATLLEAQAAETHQATQKRLEEALTTAIAAAIDMEVPQSLITDLGTQQYTAELNSLIEKGVMSYEQVQQLASPEMAAKYVEKKKEDLVDLQKGLLGFDAIIGAEGLAATEEEMLGEYEAAVETFQKYEQQWDDDRLREQIKDTVQGAKVMQWLMENAKVTIKPYSGEKKKKTAAAAGKKKAPAKKKATAAADGEEGGEKKPAVKRGRPKKVVEPEA
jgi:trigger factor